MMLCKIKGRKIWAYVLFITLLVSSPLFAQDLETQPSDLHASANRPLSLLYFGEILSTGVSWDYFYYKESIDASEDVQAIKNRDPNLTPEIIGAPKSTEYGGVVSINFGAAYYSWKNRLFLRPQGSLRIGFDHQYDGSLQGEPIQDGQGAIIGMEYAPYKFKKNNIFLAAACDLGYAFPAGKLPFVLYTGVDYKMWYRDLLDNQGKLYFSFGVNNSEIYHALSVPIGVLITKPMSTDLMYGLDAKFAMMFYGSMLVTMSTSYENDVTNYPAVVLGNRPMYSIEIFALKKVNENTAVKFAPHILWYRFGRSNTDFSTTSWRSSDGNTQTAGQHFYEPESNSLLVGFTLSLEFLNKPY